MVHELLGITNNRVVIPNNEDIKEVVLSPEQDDFYSNVSSEWSNFLSLQLILL